MTCHCWSGREFGFIDRGKMTSTLKQGEIFFSGGGGFFFQLDEHLSVYQILMWPASFLCINVKYNKPFYKGSSIWRGPFIRV